MILWCVVQILVFRVVRSISKVHIGFQPEVEIQYVNPSDRINTIFQHFHARVISENVGNLIFREKVLDLRPKSVQLK